ncbi:MAG TPA: PASTA domain-containing protein [Gemmatimonadaceae bacterium]|nr:PASTA domain-containing protein [Gemmatimonadaceae bacterium]
MNLRYRARLALPYVVAATGGFLTAYLVVAFAVFPAEIVPDDALVPNVTGELFDQAAQQLQRAGFRAAQGESRVHASAPRSTVLAQNPAPGSRESRGTRVVLDVSAGQRVAPVPSVVGQTRPGAEVALENVGFDVGDVSLRPSARPRGEVLETRPAAGARLTLPGPVALVLSAGPTSVTVPDLVGRTFPQARSILEQLGLRVGAVTIDSAAFEPANTVVEQDPGPGGTIPGSGAVALRISGRTR